jgi:hypothetical protein
VLTLGSRLLCLEELRLSWRLPGRFSRLQPTSAKTLGLPLPEVEKISSSEHPKRGLNQIIHVDLLIEVHRSCLTNFCVLHVFFQRMWKQ